MKVITLAVLAVMCLTGYAQRHSRLCHIEEVHGKFGHFWYWMQNVPSTKHGICGEIEGPEGVEPHDLNDAGSGHIWVVDLPDTHPGVNGYSRNPTAQYIFNTVREATAYIEKHCPTR